MKAKRAKTDSEAEGKKRKRSAADDEDQNDEHSGSENEPEDEDSGARASSKSKRAASKSASSKLKVESDDDADNAKEERRAAKKSKKDTKETKSKSKSKSSKSKKVDSKSSSKGTSSKGKKSTSSSSSSVKTETKPSVGKVKLLSKLERLEEARKAFKWWETEPLPEGINWRTMEHPGVVFAPAYQSHHIPLIYKGKEINLNAEQEELATFFAAIPEDGPQLGNPATRDVFIKNFFEGFKEAFPSSSEVQNFEDCDFSQIKVHLNLKKSLAKAATGEEKEAKKSTKDQIMLQYAYGLIDGRLEKVLVC
jgi:DNA topoisomerase-1